MKTINVCLFQELFKQYPSSIDDLALHSRSQCVSDLTTFFNLQYLGQYFKLLHSNLAVQTVDLVMAYTCAHARFDDLELDLDFENVCKACEMRGIYMLMLVLI